MEIASKIGVSVSTVYRELNRKKNKSGGYSWRLAYEMTQERKERLPGNRSIPEWVRQKVIKLVRKKWSPKQISGYLGKYEGIGVSHETIYKWIRQDKEEGGALHTYCRHKLNHRKRPVGATTGSIPDRLDIAQRPKEADGSRFGDFEMDTMIGVTPCEAILTITERKTNFIMIKKLPMGRNSKQVSKQVYSILLPFKDKLKTITTDNGGEFAAHRTITGKLGVKVYFTGPYSVWQKEAVENANKLIRQYIRKGASFKDYSEKEIEMIQHKLNTRPREKLEYNSPIEQGPMTNPARFVPETFYQPIVRIDLSCGRIMSYS